MNASSRTHKLQLIGKLASLTDRRASAQALAALYGAHDLVIFQKDPDVESYLPAPGFQQTFPHGKKWQAFLTGCENDGNCKGHLPVEVREKEIPALGKCPLKGFIVVLLGAAPEMDEEDDLLLLAPVLVEVFDGGRKTQLAAASTALAREKEKNLATLAESLENAHRGLADALQEAKSAQIELRRADQRKDEFLAVLAHELRNPLAPISNGLAVLAYVGADPEKVEEVRLMMEKQLRHMVRLIDDLMDVSRITRGKIALREERVALSWVIEMALESNRGLIGERAQQLIIDLPSEPIILFGDPSRLVQIFSNLLNNASKYTPVNGRLLLAARKDARTLNVSISDDGIGMTSAQLVDVFEMFAQVDVNQHGGKAGLGIGLSLVQRLLELHGGSIEATSQGLDAGSTFTVTLPYEEELQAPLLETSSPPAGTATRQLRVCIVDDNVDSANSLAMAVRMSGHQAECFFDPLHALDAASTFGADVYLLDIGLPHMDGFELCRQLRLQAYTADALFVAQTGWGQETDRFSAKEAGFDSHLVKPFPLTQLTEIIDQFARESCRTGAASSHSSERLHEQSS